MYTTGYDVYLVAKQYFKEQYGLDLQGEPYEYADCIEAVEQALIDRGVIEDTRN